MGQDVYRSLELAISLPPSGFSPIQFSRSVVSDSLRGLGADKIDSPESTFRFGDITTSL